jgi:sigma-B regulation protein RsbU (phosphoserine phosphatase)
MKIKRTKRLNFGLKTKMLTAFLGLSLIALIVFGVIALNGIVTLSDYSLVSSRSLGDSAVNDSTVALENQAKENLLRLVKDQADISNNVFTKVESEMHIMIQYASMLLNRSSIRQNPVYSQQQMPPSVYDASVNLLAPNVTMGQVRDEVNYTSNMDDIFKVVYANDPVFTQVFLGTSSGVSQLYPWTSGIDAVFDATQREWFKNAMVTGDIYWSEPYIDVAGHGLMVTCSMPVGAAEKGYFWVIGFDVTIDTINQNIINTQIGELGYAFLLDGNGKVINHPALVNGTRNWNETFQTDNLLLSENEQLRVIAQNMTQGKTGIAICKFGGSENYIAYAPLTSTNWSVCIVLPVDEIIAPAIATKNKITDSMNAASDHINGQAVNARNTFVGIFVILALLVFATSLLLARMIVKPILALKKGAETIGAGNLESRVNVKTGDELEALSDSFNKMAQDLQEHIAELQRTTAEKERFMKELEIAKGIQQSFLPDKEPKIEGIDIAASNIPAREVGGDFYDFIPVGKDRWGLTIADVSGKGVPAALFMALSRTLIRASATGNPNVATAIERANDLICADAKSGMFVTLFYAILDTQKRKLKYVNAGHNPPLLLKEASSAILLLKAQGIALGVVDGIKLEEAEIQLEKGDLITLFTDGVTEAINEKEEQFGQQRLLKIIKENESLSAKDIIKKIQDEVTAFSGGLPQFDDITLMIIKVN